MPSQSDVREITKGGGIAKKRRFDQSDWKFIAEFVIETHRTRKENRRHRERHWKEIDRQVAMEPCNKHKVMPDGTIDTTRTWMAEMELPLQAQALEILTGDARRMLFPPSGPWFKAHAETTDEYLDRADFSSIILGDKAEVPSLITQDNADHLVRGFILNFMRQNDFKSRMDRINAESFQYGMGIGRVRKETKNVYIHESRGVIKEEKRIPVVVPNSIKRVYLAEPLPSTHSAQVLGEAIIAEDWMKLDNLRLAANRGSNDPNNEDGGWMSANVKRLEPDENGMVQLLELEGDIVVPRKTVRSIVIPGAIVTVAIGGKNGSSGEVTRSVVRFRYRKMPFSSYVLFPYHHESVDEAYPTSPLMKGRPVQIAAVDALNRLMDAAALKNAPPVAFDKDDTTFGGTGGPRIHPNALWETLGDIKVYSEIGGEPAAMSATLSLFINLYAELTGVLPSRLGAQTVSHTTAFAKDAEIQRGASRTVDFVQASGDGPFVRMLDMMYQMGLSSFRPNETMSFYIESYGGYVNIGKEHLPTHANFEWFGAGGPAEQAQREAKRVQSLQTAIQIDQIKVQQGEKPSLDLTAAQAQTLREGGWTDVDTLIKEEPVEAPLPVENPGIVETALRGIDQAA